MTSELILLAEVRKRTRSIDCALLTMLSVVSSQSTCKIDVSVKGDAQDEERMSLNSVEGVVGQFLWVFERFCCPTTSLDSTVDFAFELLGWSMLLMSLAH